MHDTHEFDRDEFQRAVRDADESNRAAMPRFNEALKRYFSRDSKDVLPAEQQAAVLGVPMPGRRAFFRTGGLVAVGAVAFAACGDDDAPTTDADADGTTGGAPTEGDVGLATAAIQIENTAVAVYTKVAQLRGADLPPEVVAAATLFAGHHTRHAAALNTVLTSNGATAVGPEVLFAGYTPPDDPTIQAADVPTLGGVAKSLENAAAATYIEAVPMLSLPLLRQALMGIGGAEARHVTAWDILLGGGVGGYDAALVVGGNYPTDASLLP